jgi:hypothetical protein
MHPRSPARLPLGRTILAIAAAYLFALQGLAGALAAASHFAGGIDPALRLLCLTGPGPTHPQAPGPGDDPGACCILHCGSHAPASAAPPASAAIRIPTEAARAAAGDTEGLQATLPRHAFSARAPPDVEA